jgi:hypothetical protein
MCQRHSKCGHWQTMHSSSLAALISGELGLCLQATRGKWTEVIYAAWS